MLRPGTLLVAGSLWVAGLVLGWPATGWGAADEVVTIRMVSSDGGAQVAFDPVGVLVRPGTRVRWVNEGGNVHTATAYHPANGGHALRIPASATPWNSGYLINPGDTFEVRLTAEGVYDYYCIPHEQAGMVGRIVVAGSGSDPARFPPYPDQPPKGAKELPKAALQAFPSIADIMQKARIGATR